MEFKSLQHKEKVHSKAQPPNGINTELVEESSKLQEKTYEGLRQSISLTLHQTPSDELGEEYFLFKDFRKLLDMSCNFWVPMYFVVMWPLCVGPLFQLSFCDQWIYRWDINYVIKYFVPTDGPTLF